MRDDLHKEFTELERLSPALYSVGDLDPDPIIGDDSQPISGLALLREYFHFLLVLMLPPSLVAPLLHETIIDALAVFFGIEGKTLSVSLYAALLAAFLFLAYRSYVRFGSNPYARNKRKQSGIEPNDTPVVAALRWWYRGYRLFWLFLIAVLGTGLGLRMVLGPLGRVQEAPALQELIRGGSWTLAVLSILGAAFWLTIRRMRQGAVSPDL